MEQSTSNEDKLNFNNISDDDLADNPYLTPEQKSQLNTKNNLPKSPINHTQPQQHENQPKENIKEDAKKQNEKIDNKIPPHTQIALQNMWQKLLLQLLHQDKPQRYNLLFYLQINEGIGQSYRICEFCEVKNENSQIEDYYRLECSLRQSDQEIVQEKIKWLKKTIKDIEKQIGHEREDISLLQASSKRQIDDVQNKISNLHKEKQRLEKLKEQLLKSVEELSTENKVKDQKIKELSSLRAQKLIELDKTKTKIENKEKERNELIKEISKYDNNFRSFIQSETDQNDMNLTLEDEIVYQQIPGSQTIIIDESFQLDQSLRQPQEEQKRGALSKTIMHK
ncbi:UNKNOWN [Stylonychia lemnae]|uniref:Uncharacterized protein n=1 Tax=Stylonychia lemnae TaxID=5949 RepID=A0A078A0K4_STYLE|nr:UNKNOWN [Stylonychia lemnae]|eukprot:CDW74988.1 UNKNOWN [Stylonychia lemnae]